MHSLPASPICLSISLRCVASGIDATSGALLPVALEENLFFDIPISGGVFLILFMLTTVHITTGRRMVWDCGTFHLSSLRS